MLNQNKMETKIEYLLELASSRYKDVARLLKPELRRWLQYRGCDIETMENNKRILTLHFQTSSKAVMFDCSVEMGFFSRGVEINHLWLRYKEIYDYFKAIKDNMNEDVTETDDY